MIPSLSETRIQVLLYNEPVGEIWVRGSSTVFQFSEEYLSSIDRPVMGLRFEERLFGQWTGQDRLPAWFSNLLPEGRLRDLLESALNLSRSGSKDLAGEIKLVEALGRDLPGAVELRLRDGDTDDSAQPRDAEDSDLGNRIHSLPQALRFSVAGVGLKFSMLRSGAQFVAPTSNESGDWIVKFPDREFANLPRNEYTIMTLAKSVGIDVPEVSMVRREEVEVLHEAVWGSESEAFAVRRFDRISGGLRIHSEDLAQVRGYYPRDKYEGTYETVANLFFRGRDLGSLVEFTRRLVFSVLIGNSDAHLKNWSLIYRDKRIPTISPAYDLVSAAPYSPQVLTRELALKFRGSRNHEAVDLASIRRLEQRLRVEAGLLTDVASETMKRTLESWKVHDELLGALSEVRGAIAEHLTETARLFQ